MRIEPTAMIDAEFERLCDTLADVVAERRQEWRQFAACRGVDTSVFFSERGSNSTVDLAKEVCAGCPVAVECLDYAHSVGTRFGIWGGRSAHNHRLAKVQKSCEICGRSFLPNVPQGRLCSDECRNESRRRTLHNSYLRAAS